MLARSLTQTHIHTYIHTYIHTTGIFKANPNRLNPRMRTVRAVYKTHIDCIHFRRTDMNETSMSGYGEQDSGVNIGPGAGSETHKTGESSDI